MFLVAFPWLFCFDHVGVESLNCLPDKICCHTQTSCIIGLFSALSFITSSVAQSACQHSGVRRDVTRQAASDESSNCLPGKMSSHGGCTCPAFFPRRISSRLCFGPAARAGYQHKGQKRSDPGDCLQPIRFLRGCEQARCNASLPKAVRYEFCRVKCASWGQMQRLGD